MPGTLHYRLYDLYDYKKPRYCGVVIMNACMR
jgi:hypothetical protein